MATSRSLKNVKAQSQVTQHKRGCLFRSGRGLLILVVLWVFLNLLGIVYQQASEASDKQAFPPPGQMVDVGRYRLHIHCNGEGSPTVILEAGTGGSSLDWLLVQPTLAETTRVCAYDRQGYAWSEDGTHTRTSQQVATGLHTLLTNANIEGPYILVGHSIGVIHVQAFTDQYPDEVAGIVMVDRPAAEYLTANLSDEAIVEGELSRAQTAIARLLSLVGIFRLSGCLSPICNDLPADMQPIYSASANQTRYFVSVGEEMDVYAANLHYGAALPPISSDLPLVVLIHEPDVAANPNEPIFYEDRVAFASRLPNARVVVAEGSNHFIQTQRPELVIQAIQDVVASAQTGEPLAQQPGDAGVE